jgi:hypothetical protein
MLFVSVLASIRAIELTVYSRYYNLGPRIRASVVEGLRNALQMVVKS